MPMALSIRRAAAIPDPPEGGVEYLGDPGGQALLFRLPRESIGMVPGEQTPVGPADRLEGGSGLEPQVGEIPLQFLLGFPQKGVGRRGAEVASPRGPRAVVPRAVPPPGRRRHSSPSRSNRRSTPCGYSRKAASRSAASRVSSMEGTRAKRT